MFEVKKNYCGYLKRIFGIYKGMDQDWLRKRIEQNLNNYYNIF